MDSPLSFNRKGSQRTLRDIKRVIVNISPSESGSSVARSDSCVKKFPVYRSGSLKGVYQRGFLHNQSLLKL